MQPADEDSFRGRTTFADGRLARTATGKRLIYMRRRFACHHADEQ
jgi:hypothetical protein